jgi:drug/metabolite transporter (DMT)-like permease
MLVLCTVIWGGTFAAVKFALDYASPWLLVAVRFAAAGLLFVLLYLPQLKNIDRATLVQGGILGVIFFASFGLQTLGLQYTTTSRSAFLTETLVLFTPVLAFLFYRKLPAWATAVGAVIVITGLYLLTSPSGFVSLNRGDVLTLGCAIAFSFYIIGVDRWSTPERRGALSTIQSLTVALLALPLAFAEEFRFEVNPTLGMALAYLIIPGTVIVVMVQMRYQPQSTPAHAGVIFALEPVFATLYALMLSLEPFQERAVWGALAVTAGVVFSETGETFWKRLVKRRQAG